MFLLRRPSAQVIERVISDSQHLPLSYAPVGLVARPLPGFDIDETNVIVGHGKADFDRACAALRAWRQFGLGWTELFPQHAPIEPGTVVVLLVRHLGFWSLNGCRVVYRVSERESEQSPPESAGETSRYGFAYGTLSNHAEMGEEVFEVVMDRASGDVSYRIRAVSRPRSPLARLGYPIARVLQARFRRESVLAMRRLIAGR